MSARRLSLAVVVAVAAMVAWFLFRHHPKAPSQTADGLPPPQATAAVPDSKPKTQNSKPTAAPAVAEEPPGTLAAELNAPGGNITQDLSMLNDVFNSWRLDFPHIGNPVGDNVDITAAFTGNNPLRLQFIARTHRAINAQGELCDRWGTPFRFHALSGDHMEIRSAGPDKKFGTPDDSLLTPP